MGVCGGIAPVCFHSVWVCVFLAVCVARSVWCCCGSEWRWACVASCICRVVSGVFLRGAMSAEL